MWLIGRGHTGLASGVEAPDLDLTDPWGPAPPSAARASNAGPKARLPSPPAPPSSHLDRILTPSHAYLQYRVQAAQTPDAKRGYINEVLQHVGPRAEPMLSAWGLKLAGRCPIRQAGKKIGGQAILVTRAAYNAMGWLRMGDSVLY